MLAGGLRFFGARTRRESLSVRTIAAIG